MYDKPSGDRKQQKDMIYNTTGGIHIELNGRSYWLLFIARFDGGGTKRWEMMEEEQWELLSDFLPRRSRYLVNEDGNNLNSPQAFFTYDVHFGKAVRHLNTLILHFNKNMNTKISPIKVKCARIKKGELTCVSIQ